MPLTIKPPRQPSLPPDSQLGFSFDSSFSQTTVTTPDREPSPGPPLASPLTPTISRSLPFEAQDRRPLTGHAQPAQGRNPAKVELIDRPPAKPFSGEDATDAIALRAAISSLQFQRKKAEEDIKALRKIKEDALTRPDAFQEHVIATAAAQSKTPRRTTFDINGTSDMDQDSEPDSSDDSGRGTHRDFQPIPTPQDVVRCPPVNWDKYHIVGEPLDRMHNVQQSAAPPRSGQCEARGLVSAAYDPAADRLSNMPDIEAARRKDSGASATEESPEK